MNLKRFFKMILNKTILNKRYIPFFIILIGFIGLVGLIRYKPKVIGDQSKYIPPLVETIKVENRDVQIMVKSQGEVIPRTEINLTSEVSGKIIWVSENFSSGGTFIKGDTLIKLDSRDYELALVTAESNLSQSKVALQREIAESNIAKQEWNKVSDGEASDLALRKPQLAQANAFFAASEATYEQAKRNLNRTSILAPFDGRVRKKNTDLGAIISPGIPLGMIYATDYVEVRLPIANVDLSFLDIPFDGTLIELNKQPQVELFSKIGNKTYEWTGKIIRSEAEIDPLSRMLSVVARVSEPYDRSINEIPLKVGLYVNANIFGKKFKNIYVVPRHVISNNNFIWTTNKEGILFQKQVEVLRTEDNYAYIYSGLNSSDEILITKLGFIINGMQIRTN